MHGSLDCFATGYISVRWIDEGLDCIDQRPLTECGCNYEWNSKEDVTLTVLFVILEAYYYTILLYTI